MAIVYLDNAATTRVLPEVADAVRTALLDDFGNPSSLHRLGLQAEKAMEKARGTVAKAMNCQAEEIYFLSGGTEGNNLAIKGAIQAKVRQGRHVLTTAIEHPAVLDTCKALEAQGLIELELLPVDQDGVVAPAELEKRLRDDTVLVSVMMVNNETGSVQPIEAIGRRLKQRAPRCLLHVDAIQAVGKLDVNLGRLPVDLLTLSGHKLHGPKGIGALFVRKQCRIQPQMHGGGQEDGLRSGTENIPGILGLARAMEQSQSVRTEAISRVEALKMGAWEALKAQIPEAHLNGSFDATSPYILNLGFPGLRGEVLIHYLEAEGVFVSTGSACSSRKHITSHVLRAMGIPESVADGSIRISFSHLTTEDDIERLTQALVKSVGDMRRLMR